jgi:hypothetical protein
VVSVDPSVVVTLPSVEPDESEVVVVGSSLDEPLHAAATNAMASDMMMFRTVLEE